MKIVLLALLIAASGCAADPAQTEPTTGAGPQTTAAPQVITAQQRQELAAATALWRAAEPASYRLRYVRYCECLKGPFAIVVTDGVPTSLEVEVDGGSEADVPYRSVDSLLASISAAVESDAVPIEVTFDTDFGYPSRYSFDPPGQPADAGFVIEVLEFIPLG